MLEAGEDEQTIMAELEPDKIAAARKGIPLNDQRRFDVYPDICLAAKYSSGLEGQSDI